MKKTLSRVLIILILILSCPLTSKELKIDDSFLIGKLDNQLTYYIKENKVHEDKISLRLLVRVGSAVETDEERGIAHFIEHLVFRGSENYKDREVIKYLESIGAELGPDTNAFTSYDKTCYVMEIPLKNKEDLEKGFSFLSDFAFKATLEDEKIDRERQIVLDELRLNLSPQKRVMDKHCKVIFKGTSYEDRDPIGKEQIIKNCSYETIRNFYKKWYAPRNMAVIAVGDFDKQKVEEYIKKYFSLDIKNENVPSYIVNPNETMDFNLVDDSEISHAQIDLVARYKPVSSNSENDFKTDVIHGIIVDILNDRFQSAAKKADSGFICANFFESSMFTNLFIEDLAILCWSDNILKGLETALYEVQKLKNLGITQEEFQRAVKSRKESAIKQKSNLDKIDNEEYVSDCFDHFIYGDKIFDRRSILEYKEELFDRLTFDEVLCEAKDFDINYHQCSVCATLPQNASVSQEDIAAIIENSEHLGFEHENEKETNEHELIVTKTQIIGEIKDMRKDEKNNVTKVEFSNGLKCFLKPTDLKKDEIIIHSCALGGKANISKDIYDNAQMALPYFYYSGIAGIDPDSFYKLLDLKNSSLNVDLSYNSRKILAKTTKAGFEDIIKLINRIFTSKNYQDDMWNKTVKMIKEAQNCAHTDPQKILTRKTQEIFTSDAYFVKEIDLNKGSLKKTQDVIDAFFSDPKDFTFFIVGDFDVDSAVSILQNYLGSVSDKTETKIEISNLPDVSFPPNKTTQVIKAGQEDKSYCIEGYDLLSIGGNDLKQWRLLELMRPIIKERLYESLRQKQGKTYSIINYCNHYFFPNLINLNYFIEFSGPPESIDSLKEISLLTMNELIKNGVTQSELETAKKILKNDIKEGIKYNSYFAHELMDSQMLGYEYNEDYEQIIDRISIKDMNSFIERLFSKDKYASVIWLPKEK